MNAVLLVIIGVIIGVAWFMSNQEEPDSDIF